MEQTVYNAERIKALETHIEKLKALCISQQEQIVLLQNMADTYHDLQYVTQLNSLDYESLLTEAA